MASRTSKLLTPIVLEAKRLHDAGTRLNDPAARRLAEHYARTCQQERMGDPCLHAGWIAAFGMNEATRPAWDFLARLAAR